MISTPSPRLLSGFTSGGAEAASMEDGRIWGRPAEGYAPGESHDHDNQDKSAQRLVKVIEIVPERTFGSEPLRRGA
jgi:hypothetical protein